MFFDNSVIILIGFPITEKYGFQKENKVDKEFFYVSY